jgi:hypothetical protein
MQLEYCLMLTLEPFKSLIQLRWTNESSLLAFGMVE